MIMASRYTKREEGGIEWGYITACGICEYRRQIYEEKMQQRKVLFNGEFICCSEDACRIDNPLQYPTSNHPDFIYNVSTKDLDSDDVDSDDLDIDDVDSDDSTKEFTEEVFYADSTEAFDKHLGINKDSTRVNFRSVVF